MAKLKTTRLLPKPELCVSTTLGSAYLSRWSRYAAQHLSRYRRNWTSASTTYGAWNADAISPDGSGMRSRRGTILAMPAAVASSMSLREMTPPYARSMASRRLLKLFLASAADIFNCRTPPALTTGTQSSRTE
jgi:hypothetical protein